MTRMRQRRNLAAVARTAVALALLCAGALAGAADAASGALPALDGGSLRAADLERGTHVLVVWASWSPRCRDIVPRVNEVAARVGARARVATVNFQEERSDVEAFLAGKALSVPVYLDRSGDFSKEHAITTLPGLIVFRDGEARFAGRLEGDAVAQVESLLR